MAYQCDKNTTAGRCDRPAVSTQYVCEAGGEPQWFDTCKEHEYTHGPVIDTAPIPKRRHYRCEWTAAGDRCDRPAVSVQMTMVSGGSPRMVDTCREHEYKFGPVIDTAPLR